MLEKTLERIAERILCLDEASLASLWSKYKERMDNFDASRDWERAVIAFFVINAVRAKNQIFNDEIRGRQNAATTLPPQKPKAGRRKKPVLRLIESGKA
ncbi:MAG: hypothetical protein QM278_08425 [Pseudomonadota bacterium]|nr:hypothetical protein [Pseudomonadota bacterium]